MSMYPTLNQGDKVLVVKQKKYVPGDVLVYNDKNSRVVHRLVKKTSDYFILKGDNNVSFETITVDQIIGKVAFVNDKKFDNNFLSKFVSLLSLFQTKISFLYYEDNNFLRKSFKFLSNPVLYLSN